MKHYLDANKKITLTPAEITQQKNKLNELFKTTPMNKVASIGDWFEALIYYVQELQSAAADAQRQLETYNKDAEIQKWKHEAETARKEINLGFPMTQNEVDKVQVWKDLHERYEHQLHSNRSFGTIGGCYTYKFYPTSIGVSGECICNICNRLAMQESGGDLAIYNQYLKEHHGVFEFQELC
jgi:hypothetical protein